MKIVSGYKISKYLTCFLKALGLKIQILLMDMLPDTNKTKFNPKQMQCN